MGVSRARSVLCGRLRVRRDLEGIPQDVFVHASAVRDAGLRFLNEGDKLEFEIEDGPKGPSAVKLQKKS